MSRKIQNRHIRKIFKSGPSYAITLPVGVMRELGWKEKQNVVVKKRGTGIIITDWKK